VEASGECSAVSRSRSESSAMGRLRSESSAGSSAIGRLISTESSSIGRSLQLKRGPIKKPDRALQKLVRVYDPTLFCVILRVESAILVSIQRYRST